MINFIIGEGKVFVEIEFEGKVVVDLLNGVCVGEIVKICGVSFFEFCG